MEQTTTQKLAFTLGGVIVKSAEEARAVRRRAIREDLDYLIPQCDSVIAQFRAALATSA